MREFGSEFASLVLPDTYFSLINSKFRDFIYLRSGRDGLGVVAQNIKSDRKCILLPAYCCDSMVYPFARNGWEIHYYSLDVDLIVNLVSLKAAIDIYAPGTILLMNYFGIAPTAMVINEIKNYSNDIVIIEDFTHCLFDVNDIYSEHVDYYISSIRKWIGINDGAIVLSKHLIERKPVYVENDFVNIRTKAQNIKRRYLTTGNIEDKNIYRTALRRAEQCLAEDLHIVGMSTDSIKLLHSLNASEIKHQRRQNYFHLLELIKDINSISFPINVSKVCTPFALPIEVNNRDGVQRELADRNLYAPVLWPLGDEARSSCVVSARMADNMLAIPIDQRYDYDDIEEISKILHSVLV